MIVLRTYRGIDSKKIERVKMVDEATLKYEEYDTKIVKAVLKDLPNCIDNIELDKYGNIKLKNFNTAVKRKAYKQSYTKQHQVNHYCVITGYQHGLLSYIADTPDGHIASGCNVTLAEIALALNTKVEELRFFNGYIEMEGNKPSIFVYRDNGYRKLQNITAPILRETDLQFGDDWDVEIDEVTQEGVRVRTLGNATGKHTETIPGSICYVGKFLGGVNNLTVPISVHTLGVGCFEGLGDLYTIKFERGVAIIPESCFEGSLIEDIRFSGSEVEIGDNAFNDCYKLRGVIATSAKKIGRRAFSSSGIPRVLMSNVEVIGVEAFSYCDRLYKVALGNKLRVIEGGAFRNCTHLKEVYIPPTVEKIGKLAFDGCKRLSKIHLPYGTDVREGAIPKYTKILYY